MSQSFLIGNIKGPKGDLVRQVLPDHKARRVSRASKARKVRHLLLQRCTLLWRLWILITTMRL